MEYIQLICSLESKLFFNLYMFKILNLIIVRSTRLSAHLQYYYRDSARDLKRIAGISISPIYQHFRLDFSFFLEILQKL